MAKLFITEHLVPTLAFGNSLPMAPMPPVVTQTVSISGSSSQSSAFDTRTRVVGIHSDSTCSIEFGVNPTATTNSRRIVANTTEYFTVQPEHKVAVISNV